MSCIGLLQVDCRTTSAVVELGFVDGVWEDTWPGRSPELLEKYTIAQ